MGGQQSVLTARLQALPSSSEKLRDVEAAAVADSQVKEGSASAGGQEVVATAFPSFFGGMSRIARSALRCERTRREHNNLLLLPHLDILNCLKSRSMCTLIHH